MSPVLGMIHLYETRTGSSLQHIFVFQKCTLNYPYCRSSLLFLRLYTSSKCCTLCPSIYQSKLFSITQMEVWGISAHTNVPNTWDREGYPYLIQLCTPARAPPWSKTLVTGDPTSALCPFCSFSVQTSPGLNPLTICSFTTGILWTFLDQIFQLSFVPKESSSHALRQPHNANQSTACRDSWETCIKSALLMQTKKLT